MAKLAKQEKPTKSLTKEKIEKSGAQEGTTEKTIQKSHAKHYQQASAFEKMMKRWLRA